MKYDEYYNGNVTYTMNGPQAHRRIPRRHKEPHFVEYTLVGIAVVILMMIMMSIR